MIKPTSYHKKNKLSKTTLTFFTWPLKGTSKNMDLWRRHSCLMHANIMAIQGKIYSIGGLQATIYDWSPSAWAPIKALDILRFDHQLRIIGD